MNAYDKAVDDYLEKIGVTFEATLADPQLPPPWINRSAPRSGGPPPAWTGTMWEIEISRSGASIRSPLWMGAAHNGRKATAYEALACLPKYPVGAFREWCDTLGCTWHPADALEAWERERDTWEQMDNLFTEEELEVLQEIAQ